ncbi:MAG: RES family NAD+ phosphorylase [Gemmatimonadetes bacterium]|nr:RES family NAD+ phosphorylase [Gemmatimonadota bacterium]
MRLYRIASAPYARLDGEGARLYGGRWNSRGVAVVYASTTLSLAALEYLVHTDIDNVPGDLVALTIDVPDEAPVEEVALEELPDGWRTGVDHPACIARGDDWIRRGSALLLRVPSAVIPIEFNGLLNPVHPAAAALTVVSEPFAFDPRLLSR